MRKRLLPCCRVRLTCLLLIHSVKQINIKMFYRIDINKKIPRLMNHVPNSVKLLRAFWNSLFFQSLSTRMGNQIIICYVNNLSHNKDFWFLLSVREKKRWIRSNSVSRFLNVWPIANWLNVINSLQFLDFYYFHSQLNNLRLSKMWFSKTKRVRVLL